MSSKQLTPTGGELVKGCGGTHRPTDNEDADTEFDCIFYPLETVN